MPALAHVLATVAAAAAPACSETPPPSNTSQILDFALANPRFAWERLATMCDTYGGRLSGSAALESALDWIAATARADGLAVTEEPVFVPKWTRGKEWAKLITPTRTKELRIAGLGESVGTPGTEPLRAEVLVVSSFDDLAAQNATGNTQGKIIARRSSAEHLIATKVLRCTATAWIPHCR